MANLFLRLKNRYNITKKAFVSDCNFSKRLALLRIADEFSNRLGFERISNKFHSKKDDFIIKYLENELSDVIDKYKGNINCGVKVNNAPIWVCWWTGIDTAPELVKQCVKSIYKNAGLHPVNFIDQNNYTQYLDIPDYFLKKVNDTKIGLAHFADYIRVCLLQRYGGLWIDSTIFCSQEIPEDYFTKPFFTLKSEYRVSRYLSHYEWVTFCLGGFKENVLYSFLKEAFENYWEKEESAIDYLFFDSLIFVAKKHIPFVNELMNSVEINTPHRDDLQQAFNDRLPASEFWNVIKEDTALYKLSWRETYFEKTVDGMDSVYGYFLKDIGND